MALHESIEYLDVSNLVNINDKNCIFELIKFFLELVKKPLIRCIHILCINYLIKIVRRCYDLRLTYNINVELYDIGPEVNIFVKIVNIIFAKILLLLKETRVEESPYCVDQINHMNGLIILFFTNVVNSCIRVIIPQVLFNEKLKRDYLSAREGTSAAETPVCFEDQVVANACKGRAQWVAALSSGANGGLPPFPLLCRLACPLPHHMLGRFQIALPIGAPFFPPQATPCSPSSKYLSLTTMTGSKGTFFWT